MFKSYTVHYGTSKTKMHCVICFMLLNVWLFTYYMLLEKLLFLNFWMLNFSNFGQVAGLYFLTKNLSLGSETSNTKFVVAGCYFLILIVVSFLPPGIGPRCTQDRMTPLCFSLQIVFQWFWTCYTRRLINYHNILDLKNEKLESVLGSDSIIKKERQQSIKNQKEDMGDSDENNEFFHNIEGLDPAPKFDGVKMI